MFRIQATASECFMLYHALNIKIHADREHCPFFADSAQNDPCRFHGNDVMENKFLSSVLLHKTRITAKSCMALSVYDYVSSSSQQAIFRASISAVAGILARLKTRPSKRLQVVLRVFPFQVCQPLSSVRS